LSMYSCIDCIVTSPPYYGLRDYGIDGQLGLEPTMQEYIDKLVAVFREVRRVLKPEGTCWLNIGDSYSGGGGYYPDAPSNQAGSLSSHGAGGGGVKTQRRINELKPKDLCMIPARVALALQADGWYLRSDIIWAKPNPMPESVTDRPTSAYEHIFLLTKQARYYYDADAIAEPSVSDHDSGNGFERPARISGNLADGSSQEWVRGKGGINAFRGQGSNRDTVNGPANRDGREMRDVGAGNTRNARNVWTIATKPYSQAHFATFPPELPRRCILAGCPTGGTVLDPFMGSGTVGMVAEQLGRQWVGIELSAEYAEMARKRTAQRGLFSEA